MKSLLLQRSLARRLFATLVAAFMLACLVLTVKDVVLYYIDEKKVDGDTGMVGKTLAASLHAVTDEQQAIVATRVLEDQFNAAFARSDYLGKTPPRIFLQLARSSGALLYDPQKVGYLIPGDLQRVTKFTANSQALDLYSYQEGLWSLRVGFPALKKHDVFTIVLKSIAPYLLLSFPLLMIPMWIAIRRGLVPLDRLRLVLAGRGDDDLTPLSVDMKYAELEKVGEALKNLMRRLRRKIESERAFIQDAAHELRTPMAVISTQAHVFAKAASAEARQQAGLDLDGAIARASHLTEQMLSLASVDRLREIERTPLDVALHTQEMLAAIIPMAIERQIDLTLDAPESLIVATNRMAFHSIVQNLVDNALRYGNAGGRVTVSLATQVDQLALRVADDGPGIPADERERVFDRFVRGKDQDTRGTGLGLAIVAQAARALGGRVETTDGIDGRGIAFVVTLPLH